MSREDYIAVAARLFAVYIAFKTLLQIPSAVQTLSGDQGMTWVGLYALVFVVTLAFCIFLWFFPLTIARKLLPVMKEPRSDQAINASVGLSLGLTLIGVWLLAEGVMDSIYWLTFVVMTKQQAQQFSFEWTPNQIASMATTGFLLVGGAGLVFGSVGLRRLIYKLRYGGQ